MPPATGHSDIGGNDASRRVKNTSRTVGQEADSQPCARLHDDACKMELGPYGGPAEVPVLVAVRDLLVRTINHIVAAVAETWS